MLVRICRVAVAVVCLALACIGVLVMGPPEVVLVAFLSVLAGIGARTALGSLPPDRPISAIVVTALTGGVLVVLIGSGAILGPAAAAVLPAPVLIGVALAWNRFSRGSPPSPPAPSSLAEVEQDSVVGLRLAWDRSETLLRDLPPGPVRWQLAEERRRLLDQLEQHDPAGFDQWLRAAGRVDGDPPPGRPSA